VHPRGACRFLQVSDDVIGLRTVRVHEQGDYFGLRNQLAKQFEPLRVQLDEYTAEAREVTARSGETGDETVRDRVASREDDRDCSGGVFRRERRRAAGRDDHVNLAPDKIGGQGRHPIVVSLRPAIFDRQILSLDIAGFTESLAERGQSR